MAMDECKREKTRTSRREVYLLAVQWLYSSEVCGH